MFLRFRAFEAPASYTFKDPDNGRMYSATTLKEIVTEIINYRDQNGLAPIEHLNLVIENYMCGLPEHCYKCMNDDTLTRGMYLYIKGGLALLKSVVYPKYCSQGEADTRALQCISCPNNVFPDKKGFFKWADDTAVMMVGERKSKYHEQLGNCKACTCNMRSKVFWGNKLDKFSSEEVAEMQKVKCWQLKLSGQEEK